MLCVSTHITVRPIDITRPNVSRYCQINAKCHCHIFDISRLVNTGTGAPKLINSDLFLEKRATVPIKTQGVQRSSSGKMSTF